MRRIATIFILLAGALPGAALGIATATRDFFVRLPGTDAATTPSTAGLAVEDRHLPYSTPPAWSLRSRGIVHMRVVRAGDGRLSYHWRIEADPSSRDQVQGLEIRGFPRVVYQAYWKRDGLGTIAPDYVGGTNRTDGWEMQFDFAWPNGIRAGQSSRFFILTTSARYSRPAYVRVRFGNTWSAWLPALAPAL